MTEIECYQKLYGSLVFTIPHYYEFVRLLDNGGYEIKRKNGNLSKVIPCRHSNKQKYTLDDITVW